ncbi:hypothetical protein [Simiduia aestuariiviva]|uniref:Uncharacterized protein n=1 Tax=Simiduia aestuariiviva TaxID=1510459 RepID=A0A839USZ6_9GAMM|nr:hypothetical protein [Simiduia aestuariiviva]MBB3169076.1 hypothetical protein [Simiduia aestuariiviva]
MDNNQKLTYLQLHYSDALFSGAADYRSCLSALAPLALKYPVLAYALFEHEVHLLVAGDAASAKNLMNSLLQALTGEADHPLLDQCEYRSLPAQQLLPQLLHVHQLAVTFGLVANADVYPWCSHAHYAHSQAISPWLASESVWRALNVGQHGRTRAYSAFLDKSQAPSQALAETIGAAHCTQRCNANTVIDQVLETYGVTLTQLQQTRMRRRRTELAGITAAICAYMGMYDVALPTLETTFGLPREDIDALARSASRNHSQYIVQTGNALGDYIMTGLPRSPYLNNSSDASLALEQRDPFNLTGLIGLAADERTDISPPLTER